MRHNYVDQPDTGLLLAGAMDGVTDALDPFSALVPEARAPTTSACSSSAHRAAA